MTSGMKGRELVVWGVWVERPYSHLRGNDKGESSGITKVGE